jgi:gp32 DNA binding protein like
MTEFGTINLEDLATEESRLSAERGTGKKDDLFVQIPKPNKGSTTVFPLRLMPPIKGEKLFQYNRLHMIEGKSGKTQTVHCPRELVPGKKDPKELIWDYNTTCPLCEYYNSLWDKIRKLENQGKKAEADKLKDEAGKVKPIERYYYNAVVRKEKDKNGDVHQNVGPKIFSCGKKLHGKIVTAIRGNEKAQIKRIGDVTDPKKGFDLIVRMETKSGEAYPNYDNSDFDRDPTPAGSPEELKKWAASLHDLKVLRKPATMEQLKLQLARHRGLIDDDDTSFNVENFDAEYRKPGDVATEAAGLDTDVDANAEETVTPTVVVEDVSIDDDQFLEELQSMADDE